jgi:hypothetical protein
MGIVGILIEKAMYRKSQIINSLSKSIIDLERTLKLVLPVS